MYDERKVVGDFDIPNQNLTTPIKCTLINLQLSVRKFRRRSVFLFFSTKVYAVLVQRETKLEQGRRVTTTRVEVCMT